MQHVQFLPYQVADLKVNTEIRHKAQDRIHAKLPVLLFDFITLIFHPINTKLNFINSQSKARNLRFYAQINERTLIGRNRVGI